MTEVEYKFVADQRAREQLEPFLTLESTKSVQDTYYDSHDFTLLKKDQWLRRRGNAWELKIQAGTAGESIQSYTEVSDVDSIADILSIDLQGRSFEDAISVTQFRKAIVLHTERTTFRHTEGYTVVYDTVTSPDHDFNYTLGEIEIMVEGSDVQGAQTKIEQLVREYNLVETEGKVFVYMKEHLPELYEVLMRERRRPSESSELTPTKESKFTHK
jgi:adenylate cyclase class IV